MNKVATIGFFDGVHLGHRSLLQQLQHIAKERSLTSLCVTFQEHPRSLTQLLTTPDEREALLKTQGIDEVLLLDFDAIRHLTAQAFMKYLRDKHQVRTLLMGYDHRFGSDQQTNFTEYLRIGQTVGIDILPFKEYTGTGEHISSTTIRKALLAGNIEQANRSLGYPYTLTGQVVRGKQIGRGIGFPTANIAISSHKLIPKHGVWAVEVNIAGQATPYRGLLSIGSNPTVGGSDMSIEVHILNYTGDLYGTTLHIHLLKYLREERKFSTLHELQQQIQQDIKEAFNH